MRNVKWQRESMFCGKKNFMLLIHFCRMWKCAFDKTKQALHSPTNIEIRKLRDCSGNWIDPTLPNVIYKAFDAFQFKILFYLFFNDKAMCLLQNVLNTAPHFQSFKNGWFNVFWLCYMNHFWYLYVDFAVL